MTKNYYTRPRWNLIQYKNIDKWQMEKQLIRPRRRQNITNVGFFRFVEREVVALVVVFLPHRKEI